MQLNNQNGFTLVQAIFIMVVLALLGTYMVSLSTVQQSTTTQAVLQARAYQAARAGLEWGIVYGDKPTVDDSLKTFPTFSVDGTGCDVTVSMLLKTYKEGVDTVNIYNITSVATYADISSPDYVSRTLEVTIHD